LALSRLSIHLFGSLRVILNGEAVTGFESQKARALLAYLAVEADRAHPREKLAGMLWPEWSDQVARTYLRRLLVNLRRVIGDYGADPPFLIITRQTVQFNRLSDAWVDVTAFLRRVHTPGATDEQTIHELEKAVELHCRAFLEGFSLADSPAFEEWALLNREYTHRLLMDALRRLAEGYERRGEYGVALRHAWRQVELDPWREEAHLLVMRLLALDGQRGASLAQYEACRRLLRDELGVEPSAETTELYEAICRGELVARTMEQPGDRARPSFKLPAPLYNLPSQVTPFVGRQEELAALERLLANAAVRLVTITGPGGIGKTRLALALGALHAKNQGAAGPDSESFVFPHGVVFVALAAASSAQDIVPAMAESLQLRLERGQAQLFDYLRQKQLLLILDNLEHLLDGAGLLADVLRSAPGVKILATSRERLQLHGEQVFPIHGLAFPEQDPTPSALASVNMDTYVEAYPAISLFVGSALRVQPAFVPCRDDLIALARVCRLVEGMPLALELAASWADTLALNDILDEIRHSLDFLQTEWHDILRRQRSVRAVFDTSWEQLGQAEQALFPRLTVFRGGFTRAAVEEVALGGRGTAISPRLLSRLVNKSFIRYDQASDRYQMHELLRQYGAERLAQDPDHETEVRDQHSHYFCRWLHEQETSLESGKQLAALDEIEAEIENVRTACNWAASQGRADLLSGAMGALVRFYDWRRDYQAGEVFLGSLAERLAAACDSSLPMTDVVHLAMARILVWQSKFNAMLGDAERNERLAKESLAHLDSPVLAGHDTRLERAQVWAQLAYVQYGKDLEAARDLFARSRDLYREVGDRGGLAYALLGLGRVARNLHAYEEAEEAIGQCLALRQALGDYIGSAEALAPLSEIADIQGQTSRAEELIRQSLAITRDAYGLNRLAYALICSGRFIEAEAPAAESLALFTDRGMLPMAFWAVGDLSQVHLHLGDYQAARVHAEEALSLARQVDSDRNAGLALAQLGAVALAGGAYALARNRCQESLAVWREEPGPLSTRACLGLAARGLGHRDEAGRHLLAQLQWAVERRCFLPLPSTLSGIALLLADGGQAERAVEVYALAARYPLVANSRWFEEVAGREVATVATQLPPQAAQKARTRGQAADLWQAAAEWLELLGTEFGQKTVS
jgi:predicted ATPase/DNA-binding SARP family transcriptional activator